MSQRYCNKKSKKYQQLNYENRLRIEIMIKGGCSQSEIARSIGCHRSTVSREFKRGSVEQQIEIKSCSKKISVPLVKTEKVYYADTAQLIGKDKQINSVKHYQICNCGEYIKYIEELLLDKENARSPDHANALAKKAGYKTVSTKTLYNWIEAGLLKVQNIDLLRKVKMKPRQSKIKEQKRIYGESIDNRPEKINNRSEFGHFEGDSIIGADHKGQIITLVERQLRIGFMFKFEKKNAQNIVDVIDSLEREYGQYFKKIFKSITFDNGNEFAYNDKMKGKNRIKIYYAHAYRSNERGSNENFNGLVRRFIPKGKNILDISQDNIDRINNYINTMPRKILGYKTAKELFDLKAQEIMGLCPKPRGLSHWFSKGTKKRNCA